jgi:hypothetical protein
MPRPQNIEILLTDGTPRGTRIAHVTSRIVKIIIFPRSKMPEIGTRRPELNQVGTYFLFGDNPETGRETVYIGKAEHCLTRIGQHSNGKDWWDYAAVCIAKDNTFTFAHAGYLEHLGILNAGLASRFTLDNNRSESMPHVSEGMAADLEDTFETISLLLSTLGYPVFDKAKSREEVPIAEVLYLSGRGVKAEGDLTEEGFVVFEGSQAALESVSSFGKWAGRIKEELLADGGLVADGVNLTFTRNVIFSSPSAASSVVLGRNSNGWVMWKDQQGRTIDQLHRQPS